MPERKHFPSINIFASIGFEMFAMGRTKNNVIYECDWNIQVITIITYLPKIISVWNAAIISKVCLGLFSLQWSTIVPQCSYFKAREWFILQLEICFGCGAFQCNQMIFGTVFLYSRFLKYVFIYLFFLFGSSSVWAQISTWPFAIVEDTAELFSIFWGDGRGGGERAATQKDTLSSVSNGTCPAQVQVQSKTNRIRVRERERERERELFGRPVIEWWLNFQLDNSLLFIWKLIVADTLVCNTTVKYFCGWQHQRPV